ncbi:MAG: hypothetical protein ABJM06_07795 [Gilvibacter sp.]
MQNSFENKDSVRTEAYKTVTQSMTDESVYQGKYLEDNRPSTQIERVESNSVNSPLVLQRQLIKGIYGMNNKVFRTNLRADDPPDYTKIAKLKASTRVEVISAAGKNSLFAAGKTVNEHSWVDTPSDGQGWIEDSMLNYIGPSNDDVLDLSMPAFDAEPVDTAAVLWSNDLVHGVKIYANTRGVNAFLGDQSVGHIESSSKDGVLNISGIGADEAYPGLGSVMISELITKVKPKFVKVTSIVGSHGYWASLGVQIPQRYIFNPLQIEGRMVRDNSTKREGLESLARDQKSRIVPGEKIGGNDIPVGEISERVKGHVDQKGWHKG